MKLDRGCAENYLIPENNNDMRILNELYESITNKINVVRLGEDDSTILRFTSD